MKTSSSRRTSALVALVAGALAFGCTSTPDLPEPSPDVEVRALVYSGRPNPRAVLDQAAVDELRTKLGALAVNREFEGDTVTPSILGYAGVIVINGAGAEGLPAHVAVYGGNVELGGAEPSFLIDENGALEDWLLDRLRDGEALGETELKIIGGD